MTDRSKFVPPSKVNMGGGYDKINVGCLVCLPSGGPIMTIDSFIIDKNPTNHTYIGDPTYKNYTIECKCIWFEDNTLRSGVFSALSLLYYYTGK